MNLQVFLSDRCNMKCGYCFLSLPGTTVLSVEALKAAYARLSSTDHVTLLGGEPTLHPELLAVRPPCPVTLVTNGTRPIPAGPYDVCVSVDGDAATHDLHRRMAGGRPSRGKVKVGERVNLVLAPATAGRLLANLEHLRRDGARRFSFHLDVRSPWTPEALSALRAALAGLPRYLEMARVELTHAGSFVAPAPEHVYDSIVLGADGRYYASAAFLSLPYEKARDRAGMTVEEATRPVHEALGGAAHYGCPVETYWVAKLEGRDPVAAVRSYAKADLILGEALACCPTS